MSRCSACMSSFWRLWHDAFKTTPETFEELDARDYARRLIMVARVAVVRRRHFHLR